MDVFFGVLGTAGALASIIAAVVSFRQAANARTAAEEIDLVKQELRLRKEISRISVLIEKLRAIQELLSPYGPGSDQTMQYGLDHADVCQKLQDRILNIREDQDVWASDTENPISTFCDQCIAMLGKFSSAQEWNERKQEGTKMLLQTNVLLPMVVTKHSALTDLTFGGD